MAGGPVARSVELIENTGGADWLKPVAEGYITSSYGERINPITGKAEFHNGLDIACPLETAAVAVTDGKVLDYGVSPTWGKFLLYDAGEGYSVFYAHLNEVVVTNGEFKKGQIVAKTGSTGMSTGPHIHITVFKDGAETDPSLFFDYKAE